MRLRRCFLLLGMFLSGVAGAQVWPDPSLDTLRIFRSLEEAMKSPGTVYRLDLSRQKLKTFPDEVLQLTQLRELNLSRNKIRELPAGLGALTGLERFACSHCALDSLPPEMMVLTRLTTLDLSDNSITRLPPSISRLSELRLLILWDNPLLNYPNALGELEKLEYLDLLHNQMNADTQERIGSLLPGARIIFSAPCKCPDEEPGD